MTTAPKIHPTDGPVHGWFSLSYSNYAVLPRTFMQSMPLEWQERMVACLEQLNDAFEGTPQAEAYIVQAAVEKEAYELTTAERAASRVAANSDDDDTTYTHTALTGEMTEVEPYDRVLLPVADPVPHYNRGRTYITPRTA